MTKKKDGDYLKELTNDFNDEFLNSVLEPPSEVYLAMNLYMYSNGYLSIDTLKKLIKKSKIKYTEEDFERYVHLYFEYDNLIFYDTHVLDLYKKNKLRNNGDYKVFNKLEIERLFVILNHLFPYILVNEFCISCNKTSDNFCIKVDEELILVFDAVLNSLDSKKELEEVITKFKVPKKKLDNIYFLFDIIKKVYPLREKGGYSLLELNGEEEDRELYLKGIMNMLGGDKAETEYFIIMYIRINGVIELSTLQEILEKYHDIHLSINDIKNIIRDNENEWISCNSKYANCFFNHKNLINLVKLSKKDNKEYYIIEDPFELNDEYLSLAGESFDLFDKYKLNKNTASLLITFIGGEILEEDLNSLVLGNLNLLNEKDIHNLYVKFNKILNRARKWKYNGFKEEEMIENNQKM